MRKKVWFWGLTFLFLYQSGLAWYQRTPYPRFRRRIGSPLFTSTSTTERCRCINLFSCILNRGSVRGDRTCQHMFHVCCEVPIKRTRQTSGRSLFESYGHRTNDVIPHTPPDSACGISKYAQRKIMGGLDAGYGQFPWTALIKIKMSQDLREVDKHCGGTLINLRWVITAGHCTQYCLDDNCNVEIPQAIIMYKVLLGVYDRYNPHEYPPADVYRADRVVRHPEYRNVIRIHGNGFIESEPRYDVALLLLDRIVRPNLNVAPVCLPVNGENYPGNHNLATVVGWGRTGQTEGAPHSRVLQAVTVPMLKSQECAALTGLLTFPDQLCAGGINSTACPGDSGGGLQQQHIDGRWTLVGIVSNGPSVCGIQPVVYHKIEQSINWIQKVVDEVQP